MKEAVIARDCKSASVVMRERKEILILLRRFPGKRLLDILPAMELHHPYLLEEALRMIERNHDVISGTDAKFLAELKERLALN